MDRKCNTDRLFTYTMGNTNGSTSATTLVDTTIGSQHTAVKEDTRYRGKYNRAVRGYYNMRLPHGKKCIGRYLCLYNVFTVRFNRITYYCKQVGHNYFELNLETLINHCSHVFSFRSLLVSVCLVCYNYEYLGYQLAAMMPFMPMIHHKRYDLS